MPALNGVRLDVSVLLDLLVTLLQISVSQRPTVTPDHPYQNAMPMKYGMNVVANVLSDFAVTLIKATVWMICALMPVKHDVNVKEVTRGHIKVTVCPKRNALSLMALFGTQVQNGFKTLRCPNWVWRWFDLERVRQSVQWLLLLSWSRLWYAHVHRRVSTKMWMSLWNISQSIWTLCPH